MVVHRRIFESTNAVWEAALTLFFFFYWPVPVACLAVVAGASHFDLAVAAIGWIDTVEELVSRLPESRQPKVHKLAVRVA